MATKRIKTRNQIPKGPHGGMQLVLIEDVTNLGKQGDVVEVKAGYGRNYLIPNSYAVIPTPHNLRLLERYKIRVQQARESRIADLKVLAEQILRVGEVVIEAKANEENHLYGSVGPVEIAKALRAKNLLVEPSMIRLDSPLKEVAVYEVSLHLGYEIEAKARVIILPDRSE